VLATVIGIYMDCARDHRAVFRNRTFGGFITVFLGFWLVIFGVTLIAGGIGLRPATHVTKPMAPSPAA
jgi:hypothetical protein